MKKFQLILIVIAFLSIGINSAKAKNYAVTNQASSITIGHKTVVSIVDPDDDDRREKKRPKKDSTTQ